MWCARRRSSAGASTSAKAIPLASVLNPATGDPNFAANLVATLAAFGQAQLAANLRRRSPLCKPTTWAFPCSTSRASATRTGRPGSSAPASSCRTTSRLRRNLTLNIGGRYELECPAQAGADRSEQHRPARRLRLDPVRREDRHPRRLRIVLFAHQRAGRQPSRDAQRRSDRAGLPSPLRGIPGLNNPRTGQPLTSFDIYQTLAAQGVIGNRTYHPEGHCAVRASAGPERSGRVIFGIVRRLRQSLFPAGQLRNRARLRQTLPCRPAMSSTAARTCRATSTATFTTPAAPPRTSPLSASTIRPSSSTTCSSPPPTPSTTP